MTFKQRCNHQDEVMRLSIFINVTEYAVLISTNKKDESNHLCMRG